MFFKQINNPEYQAGKSNLLNQWSIKMKSFEQIIEQNTAELKTGNMQSYLDVLDDSICQYERAFGPMDESTYLRNYVRTCFRSDLALKNGHNSFGRKQFSKYIARWFRKVGAN